MRKLILIAALVATTPTLAQQQEPSFEVRAMSDRIIQEVSNSVSCKAEVYRLQGELAKAQSRIKELESGDKPTESKDQAK